MLHVTNIVPPIDSPPDDWSAYSWFGLWTDMGGLPCDLAVGAEVILVRPDGVATWRTIVTEIVTFPFEHVQSALAELKRRWDIEPIYSGPTIAPGLLVAWRARPKSYLGSTVPDVATLPATACERCADEPTREWLASIDKDDNDGRVT